METGLVVREIPPDNRRVAYAQLTLHGSAVLAQAQEAFGQAFEVAFARHLTDDDVLTMRQVLRSSWYAEGQGELPS